MRIKFTKEWRGPYGVFTKGRVCELSGPMLAAAPKGSYVAVIADEAKQTDTPANKQQETPVDKQVVTSPTKSAGKQKDESKKEKGKKQEKTKGTGT